MNNIIMDSQPVFLYDYSINIDENSSDNGLYIYGYMQETAS